MPCDIAKNLKIRLFRDEQVPRYGKRPICRKNIDINNEAVSRRPAQNNEPDQHQTHPSNTVKLSGWQRPMIAVIITALIFGAGGFLLGQMSAQRPFQSNREIALLQPSPIPNNKPSSNKELLPSPKPLPTLFIADTLYQVQTNNPVKTGSWKTYKSEKYGFTFRYPPNLYVNKAPCEKGYRCNLEHIALQLRQVTPGESLYEFSKENNLGYLWFYIDYNSNVDTIGYNLWPDPKYQNIVIGGVNGGIYSSDYVHETTGEELIHRHIIIPHKKIKDEYVNIEIAYYYR